jgi:hypothetical protein
MGYGSDMQKIHCINCDAVLVHHDTIVVADAEVGLRSLCTRCFNAEVAERCGLRELNDIQFADVVIEDSVGVKYIFRFDTFLLGHVVSLEANERLYENSGEYVFQVVADPTEALPALMARLMAKMRRAPALQHLEEGEHGLRIIDRSVRGRIGWDKAEQGRVPTVLVDGRVVNWEAFGALLMAFEGWQFRLEMVDPADES